MRRQRVDHAYNTAVTLVRAYDMIAHEDLKITNMTARPKPRPDGNGSYRPNGVAAKASLNNSIYDAGWGIDPAAPRSGAANVATLLRGTASPRRSSDV